MFLKFGGYKLFKTYFKMGLLPCITLELILILFGKERSKASASVRSKVENILRVEFAPVINNFKKTYGCQSFSHHRSNKVWFMWLQGLNNAPVVVKMCYRNLVKYVTDKDIILLTEDNYTQYVSLPTFIQKKWQIGEIPPASYTDLIRLELLIKYGGTWCDATLLCLGPDYPKEIFNSDFFYFQYENYRLASWFLTSQTNSKIMMILRDTLYEYWQRYNCLVDYSMIHLFFNMMINDYKKELSGMPIYYAKYPRYLSMNELFGEKYDAKIIEKIKGNGGFVKISYRYDARKMAPDSFYSTLVREYA